ncbi:hypothetical protein BpHYR1_010908 [Brachionus plicatilis]|uniref:Uncharacterized protein n=1 Tax=Brachionus plicatilis TaxID=10195 RepID=A0A3M7Q8N1_BRAPC|nr:hypothetical protein BpHYR1_010908 [Brachionus plicatilis]
MKPRLTKIHIHKRLTCLIREKSEKLVMKDWKFKKKKLFQSQFFSHSNYQDHPNMPLGLLQHYHKDEYREFIYSLIK